MVSTDQLLDDKYSLCVALAVDGLSAADAARTERLIAAIDELLAYREGFDPAKRLPEDGVRVSLKNKTGGMDIASLRVWENTGERIWQGRGWSAPIGFAVRWYPVGGEKDAR